MKNLDRLRCNVEYQISANKYFLRMMHGSSAATSVRFEEREEGEYVAPFLSMDTDEAQELANSLWAAGVRPEQSRQAQGAFDAQGRHLDDMRIIAFKQLKVGAKP